MKKLTLLFCLYVLTTMAGITHAQGSGGGVSTGISQTFQGLRVTPFRVEANRGDQVRVILKLQNVTAESGSEQTIAVAFKAQDSNTMGDFGNFFPKKAIAELRDDAGNSYFHQGANGLQFGKTQNEWMFLKPGGSVPVTYNFSTGGDPRQRTLSFMAELHVVWPTELGMRTAPFQVFFPEMPR